MTEDQLYREIEAYLTGRLNEEEKTAFQKRMEEDERLANQVALQQLEHDAMEQILENELKEKMASWDKKPPPNPFEGKETSSSGRKMLRPFRWIILLFLLLAVVLAFFLWPSPKEQVNQAKQEEEPIRQPDIIQEESESSEEQVQDIESKEFEEREEEPLIIKKSPPVARQEPKEAESSLDEEDNSYRLLAMNTYGSPPNFSSTQRTAEKPDERSDLDKAGEAFDDKRYSEALDLVGSPSEDDESAVRYLRGHIYFQLAEFDKAQTEFEAVAGNGFAERSPQAKWYLLLSYLAQYPEKKTPFESLANELAKDEYSDYQGKAVELLDQLK